MPYVRGSAGRPRNRDRVVVCAILDRSAASAEASSDTDRSGHVAEHVNDIGLGDAPDRSLWDYAIEHDAVLVTKDEDFSDMLLLLSGGSPVVVWVRVGNTRRQALLEWFEAMINRIVELVTAGNRLIELR